VAAELDLDPARGLAELEVARRAELAGPNGVRSSEREPAWRMVLGAATEPFVVLLLASGVLAILLGEVRDGLLVIVGLLPIVGADVITEYRGDRALEALRAASAPRARVRRPDGLQEIPAESLVPGDVVLIQTGDVVPADLRCLASDRLLLNRSALTGESVPEVAASAPDPIDAPFTSRRSMLYAGTSVVGGRGEGIVVAIGEATEFGRIAGSLAGRGRRRSPLQLELDRLVRILFVVAIGLIVLVTGLGFLRGQELGANVLAGISAAIAAIPEEPPILLAVVLGLGAYRLLRRGVLVRRLNAEEALGAIDLILTDKTGTLTQNRLEVSSIRTLGGPVVDPAERLSLLTDALRAEEDAWPREGVLPGSFTRALAAAIVDLGGDSSLSVADLVEADPVSDGARYSRTSARRNGGVEELVLGAPEAVFDLEAPPGTGDGTVPWRALADATASGGERLLALGRRSGPADWRTEAIIGFADPLRPGIVEALALAREAGIQTIVVTGDHPETAAAIARAAGLGHERVETGDELATWDDARLARELPHLHVVARSTPDLKERLVRAARAERRMVAVTGDGVNDAPALHQADVAVAMGSGTAVAREASDLVLGDDSFSTLVFGLAEGRRIVDNVQKGLVFLVSTHVALLGFVFIATVYGFGQPLLPIQILWLELFIDLATSVAFEREPPEPNVMRRPPRPRDVPLLDNGILGRIALAGAFSATAALLLMIGHERLTGEPRSFESARWLAFTALVVAQAVRAYANRSLRVPLHRLGTNRLLLAACALVVATQFLIPYVPALADAFRATPLSAAEWLVVAGIAVVPAVLAEAIRTFRGARWVA
jgi:Ca2+-transporting ATPase